MSSSAHGELSALIRVHSPVDPKSTVIRHFDKSFARGLLRVDGNGVFQIAEHHVDLPHELRHFGPHLLVVRRNEMDHPLQPDWQLAQRRRRANGKRGKELSWQLHETFQKIALPFRAMQRPRQVGRDAGNWPRSPRSQ